jgi:hypothetical protein
MAVSVHHGRRRRYAEVAPSGITFSIEWNTVEEAAQGEA